MTAKSQTTINQRRACTRDLVLASLSSGHHVPAQSNNHRGYNRIYT